MILSWFCSLYTLRQLVAMHEMDGRRFSRYHELGQYAFGASLLNSLLEPFSAQSTWNWQQSRPPILAPALQRGCMIDLLH